MELLCAGSELLDGRLNTHLAKISVLLACRGLGLSREMTLPDDRAALADAIAAALGRCDGLIVCGGLGPTFDDLTREAASDALGLPLRYHAPIFRSIQSRFSKIRLRLPAENRRQAFVLAGARVLANKNGTAPGQLLTLPPREPGGPVRTLALLPGPWRELHPMLMDEVLPALVKRYAARVFTERLSLHLAGIPESAADEKLTRLVATAGGRRSFTILSYPGQVDFHARVTGASASAARSELDRVRRAALKAVGAFTLWEGDEPIEAVVGRTFAEKRLTLSVAESCTGGSIASRLTDVPGASSFFLGGAVAYSDSLKRDLLGVRPETLRRFGAVSEECCREMAEGVRRRTGASVGLSVTGIAGPSGGTASKPVGLVYLGIAGPKRRSSVHELRLAGSREFIRSRASTRALQILLLGVRS
jgi:nicotinamide-nucleotide amidase